MYKVVVDCATGKQEEVPLTQEEIAQFEEYQAQAAAEQAAIEAAAAQKAQDRAAAIATLTSLGLTEAQINALVGA